VSPSELISKIADLAEAVGQQAGVGGSETAGMLVSYLAAHPDEIEAVLAPGGFFDLPERWWAFGRLSWAGQDGKIWHPQQARFAAVIHKMKKPERPSK